MRRIPIFLIAIVLLSWTSFAFAADDPHGAAPNPLDIRYDTALWAVVVFVGLLLILRQKAWDPILEGLKKREETIRSSLDEAKHARAEMVTLKADFQKELAGRLHAVPPGMYASPLRLMAATADIKVSHAAFEAAVRLFPNERWVLTWCEKIVREWEPGKGDRHLAGYGG